MSADDMLPTSAPDPDASPSSSAGTTRSSSGRPATSGRPPRCTGGHRQPAANAHRFDHLRRLTSRDRLLLSWLAEHYLLSTPQIARALFTGARTARARLAILTGTGFITPLTEGRDDGGPKPRQYMLGPEGLKLHPRAFHDPDNLGLRPPRSFAERAARLIASPNREHFIGANQFFIDLIAHARTHPEARLLRWWSETHATQRWAAQNVRPDGHGVWQVTAGQHSTPVGVFLEYDRDTSSSTVVVKKLKAYENLARANGTRYPVLLWVPNRRREATLLRALAGRPTLMPVATAVHNPDPAGPIWALPQDPEHRVRLHELPSDPGHGPAADNITDLDPDNLDDTDDGEAWEDDDV